MHGDVFALYRLSSSYGCLVFNTCYPCDSKAELYGDTAELYRKHGYEVKVFNLVDPEHGDSWNCMADLNGNTLMAQLSAVFQKLPMDHPARAPFNLFAQSSDTVKAGSISGLGTRLQVLQNRAVCSIISRSDIDLSRPGKENALITSY